MLLGSPVPHSNKRATVLYPEIPDKILFEKRLHSQNTCALVHACLSVD